MDLFGDPEPLRMTMQEAMDLTCESLNEHGPKHRHWCLSWSGGKDSTATLTMLLHLIDEGRVEPPERLTVMYADTRQELPPLAISAMQIVEKLRTRDVETVVVRAPLDKRFLVYILGRGVPPPNNNTLRWCTRQIKLDPMAKAMRHRVSGDGALTITGIRQGESAVRDRRIVMSCSKDGGECGQGWYQNLLPEARGLRGRVATLAPILHWRVCHIWDWLMWYAPTPAYGEWPTRMLADAYGGEEAEEINARTGCIGCPLASKEKALEEILKLPTWAHLEPLRGLKPLYRELRKPARRLRKPKPETRKDGTLASNPQRMGPLTFDARLWALGEVIDIQDSCNRLAPSARFEVDILNDEEEARIRQLIDAGTWPDGWDGTEPIATTPLPKYERDGTRQDLLF